MSPFSDIPFNMESPVTTSFFFSLFIYSLPIPVLLTFCISILLGNPSLLLSLKFQSSYFFIQKKIYNCIFSPSAAFLKLIPSFLKVLQLTENLLLGNKCGEFLRIYLLKHCRFFLNLFSTDLLKFRKIFIFFRKEEK